MVGCLIGQSEDNYNNIVHKESAWGLQLSFKMHTVQQCDQAREQCF